MATQYFSDQNMLFHKRDIFPAAPLPAAIKLIPEPDIINKDFKGFGVAITGASCYLLNQMEPNERTKFLKQIYCAQGLNLSVGRISIGSSDYSAELYSYDDTPFDTELSHFSIERDEKYIIPMIKEILQIRHDLYLFASPWSPPGWMKTGGSLCGGYMREEYVECYAQYIVKFIKAYQEHGIKISAITPQNEPETQQAGQMPACIWHPEIEAKYIAILKQKLKENNLDTEVWMYDHCFNGIDRVMWVLDNFEETRNASNGIAFHYYKGSIEETNILRQKYPNLALHFTEGGPRLYDHYENDWCKWGLMVSKAAQYGYSSFTGWNLMLDEMGGPNIGPFFCGGLVTRHSVTGELNYSGQYKAFKHIAPYISVNSKLHPLASSQTNSMAKYPKMNTPVDGFMIDNGNENVFVLINPNENKKQVSLLSNNTWWYVELMPNTISTIII